MFQAEQTTNGKSQRQELTLIHGSNSPKAGYAFSEIRKVDFLEVAREQETIGFTDHGENTGFYPKHDRKPLEHFDLTCSAF